jgi:phage shock protein PspC (stress-responsive transcriptional regulator)
MPNSPPRPLSRRDEGKWLGGVCVGLAQGRRIPVGAVRAAFVVAALLGGLGLLAYLACWLIIPHESEQPGDPASRWIVVLAQACAACVGIAVLAVLGAVATLFGFGWIVAVLAAAVLAAVLVAWPRLGPGWALVPIAALIVPAVAVAGSGLRLAPRTDFMVVSPQYLSPAGVTTYRGGLGTMLVDLRHTQVPGGNGAMLRIEGGVRRTIVALPANECVHVEISYRIRPFVGQLAAQLTGRLEPYSAAVVFGQVQPRLAGHVVLNRGTATGPVTPALRIDFTSAGGSLYVRSYPDAVDPDVEPDWPGYQGRPEQRPYTGGLTKRAARRLISAWRVRRRAEVRSQRLINSLMPGPCSASGTPR